MTTPTELEIRAAIAESFNEKFTFYEGDAVYVAIDSIILASVYAKGEGHWPDDGSGPDWWHGSLWANMPPNQAAELNKLVERTIDHVAMLTQRKLMVELASTLTNFAKKYPNLERGTWKPRELVPA